MPKLTGKVEKRANYPLLVDKGGGSPQQRISQRMGGFVIKWMVFFLDNYELL